MLDTQTLLAIDSITDIFQAVLILLVWRGDARYPGMKEVKIGVVLMAAAAISSALRQSPLGPAAILASNIFFFLGGAATINGSLKLAGNQPLWRWQIPLAAAIFPFFLYYLFVTPSTLMRTEILSLALASICFGAFLSLARHSPNIQPRTRKTLAGLMLFHSLAELAYSIAVHFFDPAIDFMAPSRVLGIFYVEVIMFTLAFIVIVIQMVSERVQNDLKGSQARIRSAFEVASDAFAVFDPQGSLLIANNRFDAFFPDAARKDQANASIATLFAGKADHFGLDAVWLENCLSNQADWESAQTLSCLPNGAWVQVSVRKTGDSGLVFCWNDISAFKKVEQVLADELSHERTLAAAQRSFVSMASHQFRTPLAVIDINAQLLEPRGSKPVPVSELSERTTRIRRTVKRMIGLMEMMLGAASAEAGNIVLNRAPADLAALVHEACERALEVAPGRIIEIDVENLSSSVYCDASLIDQVIGNILSNAIKYSQDSGKIIVTGSIEGDMAVIAVTDFGVGISPEDQSMIFERFFRGRNVKTVAGTGIGLTLARHIVDLHKGTISVDSRLGAGSTFTIKLPQA